MNQNNNICNLFSTNSDRKTRGSNGSGGGYCDEHSKHRDGGGRFRSRRTIWNTDDLEISVFEWTPNGLGPKAINESTSSLSLSAGPNPFHHECFITIEGDATKSSQLILMNMQGSMVRSIETGGRKNISLSGYQLPAGVYMIGLVNSQGTLAWLKLLKY